MCSEHQLAKKLLFLLLSFFQFTVAFSQVNEIKKRSDTNNQNRNYTPAPSTTTPPQPKSNPPAPSERNNYNSNSNYNSPGSYNYYNYNHRNRNASMKGTADTTAVADACVAGCTDGCTGRVNFMDFAAQRFIRHQQFLIATKFDNPRIFSVEFIPLVAYTFRQSIIYMPRARVTWGVFSSDFRVNYIKEFKGADFETDDWQVIMLNLFSKKDFYLRIGTGFLYEKYSATYFNEHSLSTDIKLENKFTGAFEFRLAHDRTTKILPRIESSLRVNYQLLKADKISLDLSVGLMYQNYYQTVKIYSLQTGLIFMIF